MKQHDQSFALTGADTIFDLLTQLDGQVTAYNVDAYLAAYGTTPEEVTQWFARWETSSKPSI